MSSRSQIVLVDMDGTLADVGHRLHFINQAGRRKNWKRFFEAMEADTPIAEIADWVRELARQYRIVIVTGRPEAYRERTIKWLECFGVPWHEMHMRTDGDHRPDHIVKKQILDSLGPRRDLIAFVIDDRPSVCDMWRAAGLKCHQVGKSGGVQEEPLKAVGCRRRLWAVLGSLTRTLFTPMLARCVS